MKKIILLFTICQALGVISARAQNVVSDTISTQVTLIKNDKIVSELSKAITTDSVKAPLPFIYARRNTISKDQFMQLVLDAVKNRKKIVAQKISANWCLQIKVCKYSCAFKPQTRKWDTPLPDQGNPVVCNIFLYGLLFAPLMYAFITSKKIRRSVEQKLGYSFLTTGLCMLLMGAYFKETALNSHMPIGVDPTKVILMIFLEYAIAFILTAGIAVGKVKKLSYLIVGILERIDFTAQPF